MRKDLLDLHVLVWIGKKSLKFVKTIRFLLSFSKNFSLYSSDLVNLYVLVSIKFILNFRTLDVFGRSFLIVNYEHFVPFCFVRALSDNQMVLSKEATVGSLVLPAACDMAVKKLVVPNIWLVSAIYTCQQQTWN